MPGGNIRRAANRMPEAAPTIRTNRQVRRASISARSDFVATPEGGTVRAVSTMAAARLSGALGSM